MTDNPIITALQERRSVKSYLPKPVESEKLLAVLQAGTYAPTGRNSQSPSMVAVENPDTVAQLSRLNAQFLACHTGDPFYGAPVDIVVFGDPEAPTWMEDAVLVCGNLLNAAHALGLGACWIHRAKPMFASPEGQELMRQWGLPAHLVGVANIIVGYQDQPAKPRVPRKEGYFKVI